MLLKHELLDRIVAGDVTEVYRSWKRPTVKTGGTLNTAKGQLSILRVSEVDLASLDSGAAMRSGFESIADLTGSLRLEPERRIYKVEIELAGEDPRIALRQSATLTDSEIGELRKTFDRFDRAPVAPALEPVALLGLIAANEGVRAPDLAAGLGVETKWLKARIRRLKSRGLTESLRIGYRLSPRGKAALEALS